MCVSILGRIYLLVIGEMEKEKEGFIEREGGREREEEVLLAGRSA